MRRQLIQLIHQLIRRIKAWRRWRRIRAASYEHVGATLAEGIGEIPEERTVEEIRTEGISEIERTLEHLQSLARTEEQIREEATAYTRALFADVDARHELRHRKAAIRIFKTLSAHGMTLEQAAVYEHNAAVAVYERAVAVDEFLDSVEHDLTALRDHLVAQEPTATVRVVELAEAGAR